MANKAQNNGYETIIFRLLWALCLRDHHDELRYKCFDAILDFIIDSTEPTDERVRLATAHIIREIKEDKKKYALTCEKRAEAGRKGAQVKHQK